jgi:hypothetical protein
MTLDRTLAEAKRMRGWLMALFALCLLAPAGAPAREPALGKIEWLTDYAAARDVARRTGRPMLVVFR